MELKRTNRLLTSTLLLLFFPVFLFAEMQDKTLSEAIKLFDQEKYEEAEIILSELLNAKPDHLMVNYFYGACRTENQHFGPKEIIYLLKGSTGDGPLKTDYYLGIQYHAQKRWNEALNHYRAYQKKVSKAEQDKVLLAEKILQCNDKFSPFNYKEEPINTSPIADLQDTIADIKPKPLQKETQPDSIVETNEMVENETSEINLPNEETVKTQSDSIVAEMANPFEKTIVDSPKSNIDSTKNFLPEKPQPTFKSRPAPAEPINFIVDGEITYLDKAHFKTKNGLDLFNKGQHKQAELDSLTSKVDKWRQEYASSSTSEKKQMLGEQIISAEGELYSLQYETKQYLAQAKQAEYEIWSNATQKERQDFISDLENFVLSQKNQTQSTKFMSDTTYIALQPAISDGIPNDQDANELTDELIYKIQIGAYSRGLPNYVKKLFDKLSYIRKIEHYTDDRGVVVYTTGNLTNYEDAVKMKNQVLQEGVERASVVPYLSGKRITLKEAKQLEQQ